MACIVRPDRQINLFLENIEDVPFEDNAWKDRLKGEVHFLHAYFYHNLVRLYGGVPLVPKAYDLKTISQYLELRYRKVSTLSSANVIWLHRFYLQHMGQELVTLEELPKAQLLL